LDNKDNEEVLSLHDEVLLERFNALMSNSKTVIEGMDDDTFLTHLSYFVKYIRMQQKVEEAAEAARRGEGSEREAFRMETELADYYQSLISEGKITNEQMEKLNEKINNDIILDELVKALLSDRISLR
jgi:hypothetical protein